MLKVTHVWKSASKQRNENLNSDLPDPSGIISSFSGYEQDGKRWTVGHRRDPTQMPIMYSLLANAKYYAKHFTYIISF